MLILNNGSGEVTGDDLALAAPFQTPGTVWFVNSATGTDAASPAGKDREKPLATLAQAQTNAAAGDTIFLEAGHTETFTVALTISKQLFIAAGGAAGGTNPVQFKINAAAQNVFNLTAAGTELRNILFPASVQSNTGAASTGKVGFAVAGIRLIGCVFQSSAFDQFAAVRLATGADACRIDSCSFLSTALTTATRPTIGLQVATAVNDLELYGVVFSDGTVGYSSAAMDTSAAIVTRLRGMRISALLGADILINASSTGWLNLATSTGGGRIVW